jgi:hypothetical protein
LLYTHLVLALGRHDADYVDAFYGPPEWKAQAEKEKKSLDEIVAAAQELNATLAKIAAPAMSGDSTPSRIWDKNASTFDARTSYCSVDILRGTPGD